jgi:hypothetical protein
LRSTVTKAREKRYDHPALSDNGQLLRYVVLFCLDPIPVGLLKTLDSGLNAKILNKNIL